MSFSEALETALSRNRESIGTYKEKTLHHTLKLYYGGLHSTEANVGRYIADVVREDGIYEIQSKAFYRMTAKLESFLSVSPVTVVYPVTVSKHIIWADIETGEIVSTSRSPKKGSVYNILPELYSLRQFLKNDNLSFICALVNCDEYRYADGYGKDKKKRATKVDIIPTCLIDEVRICGTEDYKMFVPDSLPEIFTSADYAKATKLRKSDSGKALLVLTETGAVNRVGTKGKRILYSKGQIL
ncbi:MAG: hypothetical protein E7481_02775 [Ruminococcaceae bacterium]|nr:hypothetical protein [Oscillospiraceae bacterium]